MNLRNLISKNPFGNSGIEDKFNVDLVWNVAAFAVIGVAGITLNILIIAYYDSSILGVFNEVYAIYILLSQIATGGIHLSVQKYIPEHSDDRKKTDEIIFSSVLVTLIAASLLSIISYLLRKIPGEVFNNEGVTLGFTLAIPGLIFFSLNKVLLSFLNGYRLMKSYAVFMAMRYILMLLILVILIVSGANGLLTPLILSGAEVILFLCLIIYSLKFWSPVFSDSVGKWMRKHTGFGSKAVVGNILLDVNTRVDVLILGIFSSESAVGIYSFASSLSDGFTQFPYVLRTNINPVLTKCFFQKGKRVLERVIKRSQKIFTKILIPSALLCIICFPLFVSILDFQEKLTGSWTVFTILMTGIIFSVRYLPFQMIFNQLGFPGIQSLYLFLFFFTNLVLNFILVPLWGMYGSAIATALAFVAQMFYLKFLLKKKLQIKI